MSVTFGELLGELRSRRGLSQSRLAHEAGFDHSYISRLEAGKREPSRETVRLLAQTMQLTAELCDRLLVYAGFMPVDRSNLFADEPALVEAARLLHPDVPEAARDNFRRLLVLVLTSWKAMAEGQSQLPFPGNADD